ncbi:MAG TPA: acylphosphatase [Phycisphaerae bacterium]|nr:acylphosphatase [Phycisphaerae bacterium]
MPEEPQHCQRTVLFSGRVQGVGFRYTTERIARGFQVTGHVRNLPDGRVEVVAEGASREVVRFLQAIEQEMAGYIRDRQVSESPATMGFRSFSIRF